VRTAVVVWTEEMNGLFDELEKLANRQFSVRSTPISAGENQIHKLFHAEDIRIHGKKHRIRRVYLSHPSYPSYQTIGWVLYCDIHSCMICSKKFKRIIGKKDKFHCKICGNIVCQSCITGMVLIREIPEEYVEACSNCYWGQEEISITPNQYMATLPDESPNPSLPVAQGPPLSTGSGDQRIEFWNDFDIEEYDGPSTLNSSQLSVLSAAAAQPHPPPLVDEEEKKMEFSDENEKEEDDEENSSEEEGGLDLKEGEEELEEEYGDAEGEGGQQTAHHAQLMLLLMSLSVATTPNNLTEEEARKFNRQSDRVAREKLRESESEEEIETHDV
jgi:hypothetical protein